MSQKDVHCVTQDPAGPRPGPVVPGEEATGPADRSKDAWTITRSLLLAGVLIVSGFVVAIASLKSTGSSVNSLIQKVSSTSVPRQPAPSPPPGAGR